MDKIQEIRKALEAATPGPWSYYKDSYVGMNGWVEEYVVNGPTATMGEEADAHLIAFTPEWLSYLLTELDAANEWISIQNETITTLNTDNGSLQQQLDTAKRENERLQSDLVKVESGNIRFWKENMSLQQRLKQAIEALEYYADSECEPLIARKALSLIRKGESHGTETR